jgi:Ni/Co efflux regulator RcnB
MKSIAPCMLAFTFMVSAITPASAQYYGNDRSPTYNDRNANDQGRADRRFWRNDRVLPGEYRRPRFVFDGWKERGLKKPAAGQAWIRVCDAFILTSMRGGRIAEVHEAGRGRVDQQRDWRLRRSLDCRR